MDEIEVLTELIWRVLSARLRIENEGRRSNKIDSQLFLHPQHRLPRPCGAWLAWDAALCLHRSEIDPQVPRKGLSVMLEKGRPQATTSRPGASRCTRRRASTTLFLAATHISTCRRSSVDAVCAQHDAHGPRMPQIQRPFGGRRAHGALLGEVVEAGVVARHTRGLAASTWPHVVAMIM